MRNFTWIILCLAGLFFAACNVTQSVHFNRDYSGDFKVVLDMSDLLDLSSELGESEESVEGGISDLSSEFDSAAIAEQINAIEGISSASVSLSDLGEMVIQYEFDDVDALSRALANMGEAMQNNSGGLQDPASFFDNPELPDREALQADMEQSRPAPPQFVRKGKMITHSSSGMGDNPMMEGFEMEDEESLEMASSFVDFTLILSSDRKIKDLDVTDGLEVIQQDHNSVTMRLDMVKLIKEKGYTVNMRLK